MLLYHDVLRKDSAESFVTSQLILDESPGTLDEIFGNKAKKKKGLASVERHSRRRGYFKRRMFIINFAEASKNNAKQLLLKTSKMILVKEILSYFKQKTHKLEKQDKS